MMLRKNYRFGRLGDLGEICHINIRQFILKKLIIVKILIKLARIRDVVNYKINQNGKTLA